MKCGLYVKTLKLLAVVLLTFTIFNMVSPTTLAQDSSQFTQPYCGVKPVSGELPLLVILLGPNDPSDTPTVSRQHITDMLFGPKKSVQTYFWENSYGWFTIKEAFVTDWLVALDNPATPVDESSHDFVYAYGEVIEQEKSAWVIEQVEKMTSFRFNNYDRNHDGKVTIDELAVLWVYPGAGDARGRGILPAVVKVGSLSQGVELGLLIRGGENMHWATIAHELGHQVLQLGDLYSDGDHPGVGQFSLMCDQADGSHLDPWAKIKLGWLQPTVVSSDGWYSLADVESYPQAYILYNPARGPAEYFIVENRWPGSSHENSMVDQGLVVWHINERFEEEYKNDRDWARPSIHLEWAAGPPSPAPGACASQPDALWDGANPNTGYSLTPTSYPANSRWADGSSSEIGIWFIPEAGPLARVYFDVPPLTKLNQLVSAGVSFDLTQYRTPYPYWLPPGKKPQDIVGIDIAGSNDYVYAWYSDGTVSAGSSYDLASYRPPYPYTLPAGKSPQDIVGIGIAGNDYVYAWYSDGTVSAGNSYDLASYRSPYPYTLPAGKSPQNIVGIGIAKSNDYVYAWYSDGSVSAGSSYDLASYRLPYGYILSPEKTPQDVVGIGIVGLNDDVYGWYGASIQVGAYAESPAILAGGSTPIIVIALSEEGQRLPGAAISIRVNGGSFEATGYNEVAGMTDTNGIFRAWWRTYEKNSYTSDIAHLFSIVVSKPGYQTGYTNTTVYVRLRSLE